MSESQLPAPSHKISAIIDTDPGVDDALAILLALASPELEILAIINSFGNTDIEASRINVLKLFQAVSRHLEQKPNDAARFPNFSGKRKIILADGVKGPLEGDGHTAQYFHGRDGLGGISQRHPDLDVDITSLLNHSQLQVTDKSGVDVALELIRSEPERSITYISLGPLTNLALMMRTDGNTVNQRLGRVVCMGGAVDVPGNTSPVAEFNFFADPYAVKELLVPSSPASGIALERFLLLPLDITTPHELPFPLYKEKVDPTFESTVTPSVASAKSPLVHFTSSFLERTREIMVEFGKDAMELHDVVAVWCAINNPPVREQAVDTPPLLKPGWSATARKFDVERTGEITRGMLLVDNRDDQRAYAPGANRAQVQAELDSHNYQPVGNYESTAVPAQVELERKPDHERSSGGVSCIVKTPGPEALVKFILERIWGVPL